MLVTAVVVASVVVDAVVDVVDVVAASDVDVDVVVAVLVVVAVVVVGKWVSAVFVDDVVSTCALVGNVVGHTVVFSCVDSDWLRGCWGESLEIMDGVLGSCNEDTNKCCSRKSTTSEMTLSTI